MCMTASRQMLLFHSVLSEYCLLYCQYIWAAREKINDFKFVMNEQTVPKHCTIKVEARLSRRALLSLMQSIQYFIE